MTLGLGGFIVAVLGYIVYGTWDAVDGFTGRAQHRRTARRHRKGK